MMKINLEIDCTPEELRQSFGLPDLRPMQDAVLQAMQKQMIDAVARSSPEALMRTWMPMFPQSPEQMQQIMGAFFRGLTPTPRSSPDVQGGDGKKKG
ncbi:hypothetical protein GCM10009416_27400 [Craurococcus roseus]|uniref:Uncharacterized protein n=1 Tax=Craurococcus roseus TaxID=77585 RepID=A0ABN1FBS9_9PROT